MQKKKVCNFRPMVLLALIVIVSAVISTLVLNSQDLRIFALALLTVIMVLFVVLLALKKSKSIVFVMFCVLVFCLPVVVTFFRSAKLASYEKYENQEVYILGRICERNTFTKNGYMVLTLDDVSIVEDDKETFIDGIFNIYTSPAYLDLTRFAQGTYVLAKMEIDFEDINSKDRWQLSSLSKNIVASGYCFYYNLVCYENKDLSLGEGVRNFVLNKLIDSGMENYDLAYAMLFGETEVLNSDIKTIYQDTGIAHLLAVSGLHVSAIVYAICFLLKKFKVNGILQLLLLCTLLPFYAYLCNFSVSVIRASLMAIILSYAKIRGKPYDSFSVLAMLATVILLINPLDIYNLSVVLSFSAVLSIILLAKPLTRLFSKIFYNKIAGTLGVLFAIQIGLSGINIYYFGQIQPLGFLANFVSIPVSSVAFIILIFAVILKLIFAKFDFILKFVGDIFLYVSQFNNFIKNLNATKHLNFSGFFLVPLIFLIMFVLSDYCFFKKKTKIIASCSGICVILGLIMLL